MATKLPAIKTSQWSNTLDEPQQPQEQRQVIPTDPAAARALLATLSLHQVLPRPGKQSVAEYVRGKKASSGGDGTSGSAGGDVSGDASRKRLRRTESQPQKENNAKKKQQQPDYLAYAKARGVLSPTSFSAAEVSALRQQEAQQQLQQRNTTSSGGNGGSSNNNKSNNSKKTSPPRDAKSLEAINKRRMRLLSDGPVPHIADMWSERSGTGTPQAASGSGGVGSAVETPRHAMRRLEELSRHAQEQVRKSGEGVWVSVRARAGGLAYVRCSAASALP
jgi:hypothetical protein